MLSFRSYAFSTVHIQRNVFMAHPLYMTHTHLSISILAVGVVMFSVNTTSMTSEQ